MSKAYYCLSLNGCKEKDTHWVSLGQPNTRIKCSSKKVPKLPTLLDEEFMDFDDKITETSEGYIIEGSIPVIAYEEDGKMYDAITELYIPQVAAEEYQSGLSYFEKVRAYDHMATCIVEELSPELKQEYLNALLTLKNSQPKQNARQYCYITLGEEKTPNIIFAYIENGKMYEYFTNLRIEERKSNSVSRMLKFDKNQIVRVSDFQIIAKYVEKTLEDDNLGTYLAMVYKKYMENISEYNSFVKTNRAKDITIGEYTKKRENHQ